MALLTLSSDLADDLSAIAVAEARLTASNYRSLDLSTLLLRRDVPEGQVSVKFPKYGAGTAAALTEGDAITPQAVTATNVVGTPDVNAAYATTITDLAAHNAPQMVADVARIAADAIIKKRNADIFALFDGFSTAVGTTDTDLTIAVVREALKNLQQANALGDKFLVVTPEVLEDLFTDLADTSGGNTFVSDNMRDAIMRGEAPIIHGVRVVPVTSGISETGDVKCGMFTREALGYATKWDFNMEIQRDALSVGYNFVMTSCYDVKEIDDTMGVEILADGADA